MAQAFSSSAGIASTNRDVVTATSGSYQAYQILRTGFTVVEPSTSGAWCAARPSTGAP